MVQARNPSRILVFLPQAAGIKIIARLAEHGYEALAVSTVPEAFDALRSNQFVFAITTRPDIDLLRNIRALPVINLEVFFHAGIYGDGTPVNSKRFDSKAFLERVEFLARPVPARLDVEGDRATSSQMPRKDAVQWWAIVANALRPRRSARGTMNAQS
ncbi:MULTISPECIES: hypothetical protein [Agrobacterium]|uniref:hypothetical protein n=1 Tax=Agrobacterium tumefaciens TaxID=358 RepID=UPI001573FEEE|nr:hypothetical protein [Agrobacterium tumefaciens]MDR5012099.1 hypothetical protein [Agrobacterium tumefaciens]NTA45438.1 hypothetical protein [Agrobacterium tumefaciens]WIE36088.1 hypothetical protein G6L82_023585 [Agrobacterium tumefaciens]